jgi:hypothetical protein
LSKRKHHTQPVVDVRVPRTPRFTLTPRFTELLRSGCAFIALCLLVEIMTCLTVSLYRHGWGGLALFLGVSTVMGIGKIVEDVPGSLHWVLGAAMVVLGLWLSLTATWILGGCATLWIIVFETVIPGNRTAVAQAFAGNSSSDADALRDALRLISLVSGVGFLIYGLISRSIEQSFLSSSLLLVSFFLTRRQYIISGKDNGFRFALLQHLVETLLIATIVTGIGTILTAALQGFLESLSLERLCNIDRAQRTVLAYIDHELRLSKPVILGLLVAIIALRTQLGAGTLTITLEVFWRRIKPLQKAIGAVKVALVLALSFSFLSGPVDGVVTRLRLQIAKEHKEYENLRRNVHDAVALAMHQELCARVWKAAPSRLRMLNDRAAEDYARAHDLYERMAEDGAKYDFKETVSGVSLADAKTREGQLTDSIVATAESSGLAGLSKQPPSLEERQSITGQRLASASAIVQKTLEALAAKIPEEWLSGAGSELAGKLMNLSLRADAIYSRSEMAKQLTEDYPIIAELFNTLGNAINEAILKRLEVKAAGLIRMSLVMPEAISAEQIVLSAQDATRIMVMPGELYTPAWFRTTESKLSVMEVQAESIEVQYQNDLVFAKVRAKNKVREMIDYLVTIHKDLETTRKLYGTEDVKSAIVLERQFHELRSNTDPTQDSLYGANVLWRFWVREIGVAIEAHGIGVRRNIEPSLFPIYEREARIVHNEVVIRRARKSDLVERRFEAK